MTFKVCLININQNTLLLTEHDMFLSAASHIPAHTTPTCWFLITCIGLASHHCLNQPLSEHAAWEQSVLHSTPLVSHNLSLCCGVSIWSTVLFFMALSQAGVSQHVALLMSRGGTEIKSLLDLQTWITALNQSGRHCARTSELRQPAPAPQLPWFPARSSQPVRARLPVGLNSGVKNERGES